MGLGRLASIVTLSVAILLHPVSGRVYDYTCTEDKRSEGSQESSAQIIPGVCYSPFHNYAYPLHEGETLGNLAAAMNEDFAIMTKYFSVVRTYYSSFYGVPVVDAAANNSVKLYLGVYMTNDSWGEGQVNAAVDAVNKHPDTIAAVLVGNENISPAGPYTVSAVKSMVEHVRLAIKDGTGRTDIPIGTVQRSTEWLSETLRSEMLDLASVCDIVGVNIYPFFDKNFDASNPGLLLDGTWNSMLALYPAAKLRLTETGWSTGGAVLSLTPNNIPSLANSQTYYKAFSTWQPVDGGNAAFWFMFFDRRPDDTSMGVELETYFGFYTYDKKSKVADGGGYPNLLSTTSTSTPTPTTAAPAPTSATPVSTTTAPTPELTTPAPTSTTTTAPTTTAPTTTAPTTTAPTTTAPTTTAPTTTAPTTATPTTATPTTTAPSTPAPTTAAPIATAPPAPVQTTLAPSTPAVTTPAPVSSTVPPHCGVRH